MFDDIQTGDAEVNDIRPPAVAGRFYPGDARALGAEVRALLAAAPSATGNVDTLKALVVPHAGYVYSGPTAAAGYALLAPIRDRIRRVVLLGPTHRVAIRGLALPGVDAFETPLGTITVDAPAVASLADLPQVVTSAAAHAQEHSLEVHLPFLQTVLGEFTLVPLAVGHASPDDVAAVLDRLWGGPETLIVVSSDLSHYLPYATAVRTDRGTVGDILRLDPHVEHDHACGATPINGLLALARRHPLRPELALGVDVLAPEGYGEIIGGGERLADLDLLLERIKAHNLPQEAFEWYLDLRRYGSVPHGGFGMGIERLVAWICNLEHVR